MFKNILSGVINFKTPELSRELIKSLQPHSKTILIDNSHDFENNEIENSYHIINDKNIGFTKAFNQILKFAEHNSYEYVAIFNSDSVSPNPEKLFSTCTQILKDETNFGCLVPHDSIIGILKQERIKHITKEYGITDEGMFYFVFLPLSTIKRIGYMDEKFFLHCSDSDYQHRIKQDNLCVGYFTDNGSMITHPCPHSSTHLLKNHYEISKQDSAYFIGKYGATVNQFKTFNMNALFGHSRLLTDIAYHPTFNSAWEGHIPFAFYLVETLRPGIIVELGVYQGCSLFSWAQACKKLDMNTKIIGIDTFEGDVHMGNFNKEELVTQIKDYAKENFDDQINIRVDLFDNQLLEFKDDSIDLLHLDGGHKYEEVKHDFETWFPKLSDHSVVLIHDTQVRFSEFGVHKFLNELRATGDYVIFDFLHSYGLGVVFTGEMDKYPQPLKNFILNCNIFNVHLQELFQILSERVIS